MAVGASVELLNLRNHVAAAFSLLIGVAVFILGAMEVFRRQAAIRVPMS